MTTRYFDPPVIVCYRKEHEWRQAVALGVRRTRQDSYVVLIIDRHSGGADATAWVPRSRVRASDVSMTCCATPG